MAKTKKKLIQIIALIGAASFSAGFFLDSYKKVDGSNINTQTESGISRLNGSIKTNQEDFYDSNVIYKLPETVSEKEEISVIVSMNTDSVIDAYEKATPDLSLADYATSSASKKVRNQVNETRTTLLNRLKKSGVSYKIGAQYDTVLSGFELVIKGKDYAKIGKMLGASATLILSETYEAAVTNVVTNDVDVYHTGIFDSSSSDYQGDGVVVAVLDTGLDYTHSVFNPEYMQTRDEDLAWTLSDFTPQLVGSTAAARFTSGLQGEDVYINKKVPYAYDYADKDADVFPINSEHGTHVAGTIAGYDPNGYFDKDGTYYSEPFTGVAPNAQLAIMKVFSDMSDGAKTSWILAALEDCVKLGVDVINMSLGSGCGFSTERDEVEVANIYEQIKKAGISLIASAANSYSSTMGSEKNGNLGLTSNPDTGTVGSPSTYDAALSIASVDGVKTPYMKYGNEIIYFNEATDSSATTKNFVKDILKTVGNPDSYEFDYVTIGGTGSAADYLQENSYYQDKIVLVKRGVTTFEEKVKTALRRARGIIIYNNVSGDISMSVGEVTGAVCSISQNDGEMLAKAKTGKLLISKDQVAGPFMSDFSSWGPTSDLKIKPEITSHGGEILSSVPGQKFDRQSGTSMAAPNLAGATALIRQYVKYSNVFGEYNIDLNNLEVTSLVNRLMMSTADIVLNKNGLPYAVRKQGAGLVNITKATTSPAYVTTYDKGGVAMDKAKFELGDDKEMKGEYTMSFAIENISGSAVSYNLNAIVMTEGVGETKTGHEETTVTQDGYLLNGAQLSVVDVDGQAHIGTKVTVNAHASVKVTVKITLSESDKQYIRESFENGMYVEGFVTMEADDSAKVDMNIPFLAFFGDWTQAPIFDEEYYDTNKDELNLGLDQDDKLMADAYATRVIGGLYSDYIATMGSYYFVQDPSATPISASKEHIALSNQNTEDTATISSINSISAGLLRNVRELNLTIVEDSTGRTVFEKTVYNQRKSFNSGGAIYGSSIDVDFDGASRNLKNNTKYTVTVEAFIDYGNNEQQSNKKNTFTFPLFIDFEAPSVTNVEYRAEYDKSTKKTKLYADIDIYDNHYAMAMQIGQVKEAVGSKTHLFEMQTFGKYITPVYSSFNSTTKVTVELTDYIEQMKESAGLKYDSNGKYYVVPQNAFVVICYDYAMNASTFEIPLPDDILAMNFTKTDVQLSPNETLTIDQELLNIYPNDQWLETLEFESSDPSVVTVVERTLVAKKSGTATISVKGYDDVELNVKVLSPGETGYKKFSLSKIAKFEVTGYKTNKAFYALSSEEREIGFTDSSYEFGKGYVLSMFPSESVTLKVDLQSAYGNRATLAFSSSKPDLVSVSQDGTIIAKADSKDMLVKITVKAMFDGTFANYSETINVTVKDPFTTLSMYLQSYKGLGGVVTIPDDRGITTISQYAFSNYEYVPKDLSAGDVIDDEDPYLIKPMFIGEDTITQVIIPEGVTTIEQYAFAGLTALEKVVLPSTLTRIGVGAFYGCENLKEINLSSVQFINEKAFAGCDLEDLEKAELNGMKPFASIVAIGNEAFAGCKLNSLWLPKSAQSLGIGAFRQNVNLMSVEFKAPKIKIGSYAFAECESLLSIHINAAVVADHAFYGCTNLGKNPQYNEVALGKDVAIIGEYAFAGTSVQKFTFPNGNPLFETEENGAFILKKISETEKELVLVAPMYASVDKVATTMATSIGRGAFAGNSKLKGVVATQATYIGPYAFAECALLETVEFSDNLREISDYAFYSSAITATPNLSNVETIGKYAFADTKVTEVTIKDGTTIGDYAFASCVELVKVTLGNNVKVGEAAFYCPMYLLTYENIGTFDYYETYEYVVENPDGKDARYTYSRYKFDTGVLSTLKEVTLGEGVELGAYAFANNAKLKTLNIAGTGVKIGDYAFFNAILLDGADLSGVLSVGESAFAGTVTRDYHRKKDNEWNYAFERVFVDGEEMLTGYKYTRRACPLVNISLEAVETIGDYAFANSVTLETITFSDRLTSIGEYAFALAAVEDINLPETVESIGAYAFYSTPLKHINLSKVSIIGEYAFAGTFLESVTLKEGIKISDGVFGYCENLASVSNLDKVTSVGAYAFAYTKLTKAVLSDAAYVGDFAFADSLVKEVVLGQTLASLGENPFAGCPIESFGRWQKKTVAGNQTVDYFEGTFIVNTQGTVQVKDGVLYQTLKNGGLELVCYPTMKADTAYIVEEGTFRLSARAFYNSAIENITLPLSLLAIGDKAFYGCDNLQVVVFLSHAAPTLEEEYSENYMTYTNLAFTGTVGDGLGNLYEGLGIVPYYMWNYSIGTNFFFGANFVDYIGTLDKKIVMVKPVNGVYYDTFILSQYFDTVINGSTAPLETTLKAIELINALPGHILLSHENLVVAARAAYNLITSTDQQALVTNYAKLTDAERSIAYFKAQEEDNQPNEQPNEPVQEKPFVTFMRNNAVGLIIAGVLLFGFGAYVVLDKIILPKRKNSKEE